MTTLFISDLHLDESRPTISRAFLSFLENDASKAEALYILGDFFEVWIGDDFQTALSTTIIKALRHLVDSGTACFFMHGNRDFLIGEDFAYQSGCTLLPDPTVHSIYGNATLLMHGDSLCTRDEAYMAFRQQARNPQWQAQVLSMTIDERLALAKQLRAQSAESNSNKAEDIMDVTPEEVIKVMAEQQVTRLIHGHTHRPAIHQITVNDKAAERVVLGDWENSAIIYKVENNGTAELIELSIQQ